jgi:hypothetical protein
LISCACFSTAAAFAGSVLMVTPPLAVCANAPDANPKDINRIGKSFFMGNSLFVKGKRLTRRVGSWMTAEAHGCIARGGPLVQRPFFEADSGAVTSIQRFGSTPTI